MSLERDALISGKIHRMNRLKILGITFRFLLLFLVENLKYNRVESCKNGSYDRVLKLRSEGVSILFSFSNLQWMDIPEVEYHVIAFR